MRFFVRYTAPWVAYFGLISWLSHRHGGAVPLVAPLDKAAHGLEYLPLGALLLRWRCARTRTAPSLRRVAEVVLAGLVFAAADELHQALVPGRRADGLDVLADAVGVLAGSLVYAAMRRRADPN
ncbi:MAG: VanZ family protein [Planctomycetes bacterium]|nr:VanZ family protein [Planctomycetota bacterium]